MAVAAVPKLQELAKLRNPVVFAKACWPHINLYSKQREVLWSYRDNVETYVPAGKMLGKDFLAGIGNVWAFTVHSEVRVVLTSVKWDHTDVAWAEVRRFIDTSVVPLRAEFGGPLVVKDAEIKKMLVGKEIDQFSYLKRLVSETGEGLSGHHAAHTFCTIDEASGVPDTVYSAVMGWAKRLLCIFNPNPCQNFVRRAVDGGDMPYTDE